MDRTFDALFRMVLLDNGACSIIGSMKTQLERLERWLADNRPDVLKGLKPPATDSEITSMKEALSKAGFPTGVELHKDIVTWLKWRSGVDGQNFAATWFFSRRDIMNPKWIAESYGIMLDHAKDAGSRQPGFYHPGWVGVLDNSYSILCVDSVGTHGHDAGQVVFVDFKGGESRRVLAPNLGEWLRVFVSVLEHPEAGRYYKERDASRQDELWDVAYEVEEQIRAKLLPGYPIRRTVFDKP